MHGEVRKYGQIAPLVGMATKDGQGSVFVPLLLHERNKLLAQFLIDNCRAFSFGSHPAIVSCCLAEGRVVGDKDTVVVFFKSDFEMFQYAFCCFIGLFPEKSADSEGR